MDNPVTYILVWLIFSIPLILFVRYLYLLQQADNFKRKAIILVSAPILHLFYASILATLLVGFDHEYAAMVGIIFYAASLYSVGLAPISLILLVVLFFSSNASFEEPHEEEEGG